MRAPRATSEVTLTFHVRHDQCRSHIGNYNDCVRMALIMKDIRVRNDHLTFPNVQRAFIDVNTLNFCLTILMSVAFLTILEAKVKLALVPLSDRCCRQRVVAHLGFGNRSL